MNFIGEIFGAVKEGFIWTIEQMGLRNTAEMKKASVEQKQANENNEISKDTQEGEDEKIRDRISP